MTTGADERDLATHRGNAARWLSTSASMIAAIPAAANGGAAGTAVLGFACLCTRGALGRCSSPPSPRCRCRRRRRRRRAARWRRRRRRAIASVDRTYAMRARTTYCCATTGRYGGRSRVVFGTLTYPHQILPYSAYHGHLASHYEGSWCSPTACVVVQYEAFTGT